MVKSNNANSENIPDKESSAEHEQKISDLKDHQDKKLSEDIKSELTVLVGELVIPLAKLIPSQTTLTVASEVISDSAGLVGKAAFGAIKGVGNLFS